MDYNVKYTKICSSVLCNDLLFLFFKKMYVISILGEGHVVLNKMVSTRNKLNDYLLIIFK